MEEKHYIEWIEVQTDKGISTKFLNPGDEPRTEFKIEGDIVKTRGYCSIHGLWAAGKIDGGML